MSGRLADQAGQGERAVDPVGAGARRALPDVGVGGIRRDGRFAQDCGRAAAWAGVRGTAQVIEDALDRRGLGNEADHFHARRTPRAYERVDLVHPAEQVKRVAPGSASWVLGDGSLSPGGLLQSLERGRMAAESSMGALWFQGAREDPAPYRLSPFCPSSGASGSESSDSGGGEVPDSASSTWMESPERTLSWVRFPPASAIHSSREDASRHFSMTSPRATA